MLIYYRLNNPTGTHGHGEASTSVRTRETWATHCVRPTGRRGPILSALVALACNAERDDPRHLPKGASQAEKVIEGGPELLLKGGSDFGTLLS